MRRFFRRRENRAATRSDDGRLGRLRVVRRVGAAIAAAIAVRMVVGAFEAAKARLGDVSILTLGVLAAGLVWVAWRLWSGGESRGDDPASDEKTITYGLRVDPAAGCELTGVNVTDGRSDDCGVYVEAVKIEDFIHAAMVNQIAENAENSTYLIYGDGSAPQLRIYDPGDEDGSQVATTDDNQ